jgi:hypothetical protein
MDRVQQRPRLAVGSGAVRLAVRVDAGQVRALRQDAELDLPGQDLRPDRFVAVVEHALVPVRPLQRNQMRCMTGLRGEVHEERLVRVDGLGVLDELDRPVREVIGQVVAVFGAGRRLDRVVVVDEVGVIGVRLAAQPAVVPLEAATERPAALVGGHVALLAGSQVPLAVQ